jgi:hypothetical protein
MKSFFRTHKKLPLVSLVLSVFYFIYVISMGNTKMAGDEIGGDPGGMVLPMVMACVLFACSLYLFLTDKPKTQNPVALGKEERSLFMLTLISSILYILVIRCLGFIPCTAILLFMLCFSNLRGSVRYEDWVFYLSGAFVSLALELAIYSVCRSLTRALLMAGRKGSIPSVFGSSAMVVFIVLVVTTAFVVLLSVLYHRLCKEKETTFSSCGLSVLLSVATTQYLYVIFKQLFLVELVKGLITW